MIDLDLIQWTCRLLLSLCVDVLSIFVTSYSYAMLMILTKFFFVSLLCALFEKLYLPHKRIAQSAYLSLFLCLFLPNMILCLIGL